MALKFSRGVIFYMVYNFSFTLLTITTSDFFTNLLHQQYQGLFYIHFSILK